MRGVSNRRWWVVLGGAVAAVAGLLCGGEIAVRWLAPPSPPGMFTPHPELTFTLTPHYRGEDVSGGRSIPLAFNSAGLRDDEVGRRVPGRLRVYVLGDSFVFGQGVRLEESFAKQLAQALEGRLGAAGIEAVNGGVPRYGTVQEVGWFDESVERVDPDIVVLGLYVGNDVLDNLAFARQQNGDAATQRGGGLVHWLRVRSQLYMWVRGQRHAATQRTDFLQRESMGTHARVPAPDIERGLAMTEAALVQLAERTRTRGVKLAVVLIPSAEQVQDERWRQALERSHSAADDYDAGEPNRRFTAFAARHAIPLLDLRPVLRAHQDEELYFALHWNPRGHAVAAAATAEFLAEQRLLTPRPPLPGAPPENQ